jgi:ElaB/YqjD/DUF883 family membrane-anchored ribosome-binding protein
VKHDAWYLSTQVRNFLVPIRFDQPKDRTRKAQLMATQPRAGTQSGANVRGAAGVISDVRDSAAGVISDVRDQGKEAVEAVAEVRDNMATAIDRSLKDRPYTTLALAVGFGFLLGALWAR